MVYQHVSTARNQEGHSWHHQHQHSHGHLHLHWSLAPGPKSSVSCAFAAGKRQSHQPLGTEFAWVRPCHGHTESPLPVIRVVYGTLMYFQSKFACLMSHQTLTSLVHTVYCIHLYTVYAVAGVSFQRCRCARVSVRGCIAWLRGLAQASTRWLALAARLGSGEDPWMCCRGWAMGWSPMTSLAAPASARVERPGVGRWGWNFAPLRRPQLLELKMLKPRCCLGISGRNAKLCSYCSILFILSGVMW